MSHPIRQHWVPQFYLRYFSTPETKDRKYPQVWIFSKDRKAGEPKLTSIRKICATSNLYSPLSDSGDRDYSVEKTIGNLEYLVSQIWPILASDFVDFERNTSVKKGVSLFLAIMYLRHPSVNRQGEYIHGQMVEWYDKLPKDHLGRPCIKEIEMNNEVRKVDISDWFNYKNWKKNDHHKFFTDSIKSQAIFLAEIFLKKRWSVIFSKDPVFITSDKPLSKHHESRETFGFATEGTFINFPLSPTRLLVMDDKYN